MRPSLLAIGSCFAAACSTSPSMKTSSAPGAMAPLPVDHIIIGIDSLARGIELLERLTGVKPVFGGVHPGVGTQNALVSLGDGRYLELMAPNPAEPAVDRRQLRSLHALTPIGWAIHVANADSTRADLLKRGFTPEAPRAGSRQRPDGRLLRWRTMDPWGADRNVLPFVIEWSTAGPHPSSDSPKGCSFVNLTIGTPQVDSLRSLFSRAGLDVNVVSAPRDDLRLTIDCPTGRVQLPADAGMVLQQPRPGVQAVSFLGDTLRELPLSAAVRERYERQLADARTAYEHAPSNVDSLIWYGRRLAYLGRIREAIEIYTRGVALHPDNPWLYRHRGHRYVSVRELDRAIADLERATQLVAGKPDEVEPDGQPNARNMPIGTLHSNIAYHLGLAYYLKGDFDRAATVYRREIADARNDDRLVSTTHWLYMSLRRLGKDADAAAVLQPIRRQMNVIENDTYHRLLLLYRGELPVDSVLSVGPTGEMSVTDATAAYGIGTWHLYNGRRAEAERVFQRIIAGGQWGAFGYVAAEAELARSRQPRR